MTTAKLPQWPPKASEAQLAYLSQTATDYALSHSILYRPPVPAGSAGPALDSALHAPLALFPSPFPRSLYADSQALQPLYNALYARISTDDALLTRVIGGSVIQVDDFQRALWDIYTAVRKEGAVQKLHLGLFRSDYLLHEDPEQGLQIKQVELNTISSSFGALCTRVADMHRYLAQTTGFCNVSPHLSNAANIPRNEALDTLVDGLSAAHTAYVVSHKPEGAAPVVLFVVQDGERNVFDQRLIEYGLSERGIKVQRATFDQLSGSGAVLEGPERRLLVSLPGQTSSQEISVVYFRAGYSPADYPSAAQWATRLLLERSLAIKCPTVALQLAGAKKVQQVLCEPNLLESLLGSSGDDNTTIQQLRASFMDMYPLDSSELGKKGLALAQTTPEDFVMKPQREGGGNNIYRADIPPALAAMDARDVAKGAAATAGTGAGAGVGTGAGAGTGAGTRAGSAVKEREGYILMRLIRPPAGTGNHLIRAGLGSTTPGELSILAPDVISELGAFGAILFREGQIGSGRVDIVHEKSGGHLLRTKARESDEGGVAVGYSVIDSPVLV